MTLELSLQAIQALAVCYGIAFRADTADHSSIKLSAGRLQLLALAAN
jgi:hypothetical protein